MKVLDSLYPQTRRKAEAWLARCKAIGLDVRPYSGYRSNAEQKIAHDKFLAGGPRAVAPGASFHNVRRAIDFFCYRNDVAIQNGEDPAYKRAGELAEGAGLVWGGRWNHPDWDHVQDSFCASCGRTVAPNDPMHFDETGEEA